MVDLLETKVETRRLIFPAQANAIGSAHGGNLLKWMEQLAAMSAMRFAGADVVTVGVDRTRFSGPIPEGEIALLDAFVYEAGETSVETHVRGFHEDPHTGERDLVADAGVTLVAVDEDGDSTTVPGLSVTTEKAEELLATAEQRQ